MNAYRGEFDFPETLRNAIPVAESGDYALIRKTRTIWVYSSSGWSDTETPEGILDRSIPSGGFKNQVLTKNDDNINYSVEWAYITITSKFTDLTDTPESYVGQASKFLAVKSDLSGIEYVSPSGAGDMLASVYDPTGKNADAFNVDNHVSGSTNKVFTATEKIKLAGIATGATAYTDAMADARVTAGITGKVDKVTGKQLSTEDYTTTEKNKLSGIASGAEVNVNADWNAVSGDAQILNKPTVPDQLSDLSDDSTHRLVTDTEKSTWNGKQDALGFTPLNSTSFSGLTKITVGTIQPSNPSIGDLWIDTN